jgi:hypothetical protein
MDRNVIGFALTAHDVERALDETNEQDGTPEPGLETGSVDEREPASLVRPVQAIDPGLLAIDLADVTIGSSPTLTQLLELRDAAVAARRRS